MPVKTIFADANIQNPSNVPAVYEPSVRRRFGRTDKQMRSIRFRRKRERGGQNVPEQRRENVQTEGLRVAE
jgi:hypothetical protein